MRMTLSTLLCHPAVAVLFCSFGFNGNTAYAEQICQTKDTRATSPDTRFIQQSDHSVIDTKTGLEWQRCLVGLGGKNCDEGEADMFTWAEALLYPAEQTNQTAPQNWRLPNVRELASIVELQCANPAINVMTFPNNPSDHVWTSSPYRFYPHYSWFVDFNDGVFNYGDRQDMKRLRLVRESRQ